MRLPVGSVGVCGDVFGGVSFGGVFFGFRVGVVASIGNIKKMLLNFRISILIAQNTIEIWYTISYPVRVCKYSN